MEDVMIINAESRQEVGKKISKNLRREGKIPAIIYGGQKESIPISISVDDIKKVLKSEKGENTLLRIKRDKMNVDALLHEIQWDYLSDNIIHVDLLRIDLDKPVNVSVPVVITGEPIGVKVEDGTFDFMTREVKVRCLVNLIPKEYILDVSELHSGSSIKVKDLDFDEKITVVSEPQIVICAVSSKGASDVEEEVEEGEEAAAVEPAAEEKAE